MRLESVLKVWSLDAVEANTIGIRFYSKVWANLRAEGRSTASNLGQVPYVSHHIIFVTSYRIRCWSISYRLSISYRIDTEIL